MKDDLTHCEERLHACRDDLQTSDARFRNTIDKNADGILIVGMDGVIHFANRAAGVIFGREVDTLIERDFGFPLVAGKKAEIDLIQAPGQTLTAEMRVTQTRWEGAACHLVSLRDITDRKQAEQALEDYAADLARSNAELERFAFVASHHLQEPLRTVILHLQLLERRHGSELDPEARTSIAYAIAGASHMRQLIGDLLSYAKLDDRDETFTPTDCEAVMTRALKALRGPIAGSGAVVTRDPLPTVVADEVQMQQLFEELLENAIKFRDADRSLRIHIAATQSPPASSSQRGEDRGAVWHFSIADNGIGIEPAYHDRIFDIFYRLHTQDAYPGTGIGLALCRKIVARHQGRIWIDSTPGEGTTIHFTLPV